MYSSLLIGGIFYFHFTFINKENHIALQCPEVDQEKQEQNLRMSTLDPPVMLINKCWRTNSIDIVSAKYSSKNTLLIIETYHIIF